MQVQDEEFKLSYETSRLQSRQLESRQVPIQTVPPETKKYSSLNKVNLYLQNIK